ncbi:MAG TPA: VOC family protein [Acidimicrobiales bacterium]|nr:VOC family protein [Acidimicrobiales bacterium]
MTDARTVSSEVEVGIDPDTAFTVFTDEMDLWWVRGPINFIGDGGRVAAVRCEPGVGGRILEIYDRPDGPDRLERARITVWEPGVRLGWQSSLDDVATEVSFLATGGGTRVVVRHVIPPDGTDRGGTAWSRVVPPWFGAWCRRRDRAPRRQLDIARLALEIHYARPAAAARWLAEAFGFEPVDTLPEGEDPLPHDDHGHPWIEFRIGNSALHIFPLGGDDRPGASHIPWVYVEDLEGHFERAAGHGARIVEPIHRYPGSDVYLAEDPEGYRWIFARARPTQIRPPD